MSKVRFILNTLAAVSLTLTIASLTQAQATRTWVSGVGDDANPCSRTAPCKTYAGAISKTAKDGEISTLDPGGFGAVTITKSITINGGGGGQGYGSILASGTNGIIVNITDAADVQKTVRLNHLDINGAPSATPGLNGIRILSANVVHVENTFIDAFRNATAGNGHGIVVAAAATTQLHVRNVVIRDCLNSGIDANTSSGQVVLSVTGSKFVKNGVGIMARSNVVASIVDSQASSNTTGIDSDGAGSQLNIDSCNIAFNSIGVQAGGAGTVRLSNNFITQNSTGVDVSGGTAFTSGTNRIMGNTTAVNGALQPITQPQ